MRRLIYKEDKGLSFILVIFETDSSLTVKEMEKISAEPVVAPTKFGVFKELMQQHGYIINSIEKLEKNTIPANNTFLEIVKGATGN